MRKQLLVVAAIVTMVASSISSTAAVPVAAQERLRPKCHGFRATIVGDNRANVLVGTAGRDVVVAKGGGDIILVGRGDDVICAGRGNDMVDGYQGRDHTWGGGGRDVCTATRPREHLIHHECEAHQGARRPGGKDPSRSRPAPGTPTMSSRIVRADDYCYGPYWPGCDLFYGGSIASLGFGVPHCNPFTGEVDLLRLHIGANIEYAVKAWWQYWDGSKWAWKSFTNDYEYDHTFGLPDDVFKSVQYDYIDPGSTDRVDLYFFIWYEAWVKGADGQWHGPTWITYRGYIAKGPTYGSANMTWCLT